METGTKIALLIIVFGMLLVGYSINQINKGAEIEPDDARTHNNIQEYSENGTLTHLDTSILSEEKDGNSDDPWSRPLMSVYSWVLALGIILITTFGLIACYMESC